MQLAILSITGVSSVIHLDQTETRLLMHACMHQSSWYREILITETWRNHCNHVVLYQYQLLHHLFGSIL